MLVALGALVAIALNYRKIKRWIDSDGQPAKEGLEHPVSGEEFRPNETCADEDAPRPAGEVSEEYMKNEMEQISKASRIDELVKKSEPRKGKGEGNPNNAAIALGKIQKDLAIKRAEQFEAQDGEIVFSDKDREHLMTLVKGTALETYVNYGIAVNKKGQLVIPLEAIDFVTRNYDPIIMPGGLIRVINMLSVEKQLELSWRFGKPLYYLSTETRKMERLSHEQVSALVASEEDVSLLSQIEQIKTERQRKSEQLVNMQQKESEYMTEIERLRSETGEKDVEIKALKEKVVELESRVDHAETQRASAELESRTLREVISLTRAPETGRTPEPKPIVAEAAPAPVKIAETAGELHKSSPDEVKVDVGEPKRHAETTTRAHNASAPAQSAPSGGERKAVPAETERESKAEPEEASNRDILAWIETAATEDSVENFKRFGLLASRKKRNTPYGIFDVRRLHAFAEQEAAKHAKRIKPLPEWKGRVNYLLGDDGRVFEIDTVEIVHRGAKETGYQIPRFLDFYKDKASVNNLDTDDNLKKRYNELIAKVGRGETVALQPAHLASILIKDEWK